MLLRIEDIDRGRCRPSFEEAIYEDLAWLGVVWEKPVRRQSDHMAEYGAALTRLDREDLLYPCFCTRADIQREIAEAAAAPHLLSMGPDGPIYPGTCRHLTRSQTQERLEAGTPYALRLKPA
jgi:glutamyl-Q tRNA(Asp) synthetase